MMTYIKYEYFEWLCSLVCPEITGFNNIPYKKLLQKLHDTEFVWTIRNDANRADDGERLRYMFRMSNGYSAWVAKDIYDRNCSVLEMMVALAKRCEETIMSNSKIGDRTGQWFWGMIRNLGLMSQIDDDFNETTINNVMYDFMNHRYDPDGKGGLFRVQNSKYDLRSVEIWYQLQWYLNDLAE